MEHLASHLAGLEVGSEIGSSSSDQMITQDMTSSHAHYLAIGTGEPYKECKSRAEVDLQVEVQLLPRVVSGSDLLCLTAWCAYACRFDDVIERLADDVFDGVVAGACQIFLSGESTSEVDHSEGLRLSLALYRRLSQLRNAEKPREAICKTIIEVLMGFKAERTFARGRRWNLEEYLIIRQTTISFGPLYAILIDSVSPERLHVTTSTLLDLQRAVSLAAGLQNDIVGLRKDNRKGDPLNYCILYYL